MNDIRAFVGHSFTEDDAQVVSAFLKYFDALQQSPLTFSWVHAVPAEPTDLAKKVLRLMEDRNLFIAICTKKQRAIRPTDLTSPFLRPQLLQASSEKFLWKTSDWIIQEIGLAIGKGYPLILLLEKDVEKPGGLQGNIEYIEFERSNPSACFDKILEMISALSPKKSGTIAEATDPRSTPEEPSPSQEASDTDEWWKPQPGWHQFRYDFTAERLIATGELEKLEFVTAAFSQSNLGQTDTSRQRWTALIAYYKLAYGRDGSMMQLEELASSLPDNASVLEQFARGLAHFGEHSEAAKQYEQAAAKAKTPSQKVWLLGRAALAYSKDNREKEKQETLNAIRSEVNLDPDAELVALRTFVDLVADKEEAGAAIPLYERMLELRPDDYGIRFSLAYEHSQQSNDALALFHYLKIPETERHASTWNNLGASSDAMGLPGQAVAAYEESEQMGGTLAMSNLANKFLSAGFLAQARELCEKAMHLPDPHRNVGATWSQVQDFPETEAKRRDKVLADAKPNSDFYRLFGSALVRPQPTNVQEIWEAPEATLTIKIEGNSFTGAGVYEVANLGRLFALTIETDTTPTKTKYRIAYSGIIEGQTIRGTVSRTLDGSPAKAATVLGGEDQIKVLIILGDGTSEMKVMETSKDRQRFYSIKRKNSS